MVVLRDIYKIIYIGNLENEIMLPNNLKEPAIYHFFYVILHGMKKLYTTIGYKIKNKRRLLALAKKKRKEKRRSKPYLRLAGLKFQEPIDVERKKEGYKRISPIISAPANFQLIENTEECLKFFSAIRSSKNCSIIKTTKFIQISLTNVVKIDYPTISILIAISRELGNRKVNLQGNFPENIACKNMMVESGFLNYMYNDKNQRYAKTAKSDTFFFKKGQGTLSNDDNINMSLAIRKTVKHLTGVEKPNTVLKAILLEICGNSIEHANSKGRQWLLGVKYEKDRVIFSVTDVGLGIIETLYKKFHLLLEDNITFKSNLDVLIGAFNRKYGSSTQEPNRNKGLPSIKFNSENKVLINLIVVTNNVILHFDNDLASKTISRNNPQFRGTMYQWELTKESILKAEQIIYDNN